MPGLSFLYHDTIRLCLRDVKQCLESHAKILWMEITKPRNQHDQQSFQTISLFHIYSLYKINFCFRSFCWPTTPLLLFFFLIAQCVREDFKTIHLRMKAWHGSLFWGSKIHTNSQGSTKLDLLYIRCLALKSSCAQWYRCHCQSIVFNIIFLHYICVVDSPRIYLFTHFTLINHCAAHQQLQTAGTKCRQILSTRQWQQYKQKSKLYRMDLVFNCNWYWNRCGESWCLQFFMFLHFHSL